MSDTPVDGWWQANNGRWYPPETHPSFNLEGPIAPPEGWVIGPDGEWGPAPDVAGSSAPAEPDVVASQPPLVIPPAAVDDELPDLGLLPPVAAVTPAKPGADDTPRRWPAVAAASVGVVVALIGVGTLVITVQDDDTPVKVGSETTIREIAPETTVDPSTTTTTTTTPSDTSVPGTELEATVPETTVPVTTGVAPPG